MKPTCDLELNITRHDQRTYAVDFRYTDSDPDNQADVRLGTRQQALAAFDLDALHQLLVVGDLKEYSLALTGSFFADESLRAAFAQARAAAGQADASLRLRLSVGANAHELHALRWELLNDPHTGQSLATDQNIFFSRYLSSADWRAVRLRARRELKALALIAAPNGLEAHKLAHVDKALETATVVKGLGDLRVNILEHGTLNEMIAALSTEEFDILYVVAHGQFGGDQAGRLWLENAQGGIAQVTAAGFANSLRMLEHRPRLVVLASCQSAGSSTGDILSSLGPRLAEVGIPAVLAMQGNITMETVAQFMPVFFGELQKDGRIDRSLSVARGLVREHVDASLPALFMRLKSGRLWYTPGESVDSKTYDQWPALVRVIQKGRCTPVLGPGLAEPVVGSIREVARQWAEKFKYPLAHHERESFPQVAQFLSVSQPAQGFVFDEMEQSLRNGLRQKYGEELPKDHASLDALVNAIGAVQRQNPLEAHRVLARLPLPVYISANPDELLEEALRAEGRAPQSLICPWNEEIEAPPPATVDVAHPLVFHFFGRWSQPKSLVLTEDDYFRFLIGVTSNQDILPEVVGEALTKAGMLFMGFQADEWPFRALFHTILARPGGLLRSKYAQVAAQLEPEDERLLEPQRARKYLEKYLYDTRNEKIEIYWGSPQEFAAALWQKWQAEDKQ